MLKEIISPKFPYLGNIFTRKGFYEDNLPGDKYIFYGYFDLFNLFEFLGKILFLTFVVFLIRNVKNLEKFSLFYAAFIIIALIISPRLFDRYILPLIPLVLLATLPLLPNITIKSKLSVLFVSASIFVWAFLGYQFTADFIIVNRYIWNTANNISARLDVPKNKISADNSWNQQFLSRSKDRKYFFTYSNFGNALKNKEYKVIAKYKVNFPFNFYKEPYVFLHYKDVL
jgi:hypothetical protein